MASKRFINSAFEKFVNFLVFLKRAIAISQKIAKMTKKNAVMLHEMTQTKHQKRWALGYVLITYATLKNAV